MKNELPLQYQNYSDSCGQVTKTHRILTGHRSIVNNIRYHPHLPVMVSSGVEKVIKVWTPYKVREEQDGSSGCQPGRIPFSRADFDFFLREILNGREEFEETTNESKETLALFDFFNGAEQEVDQNFYDLRGENLDDDENDDDSDDDSDDCGHGEEDFSATDDDENNNNLLDDDDDDDDEEDESESDADGDNDGVDNNVDHATGPGNIPNDTESQSDEEENGGNDD